MTTKFTAHDRTPYTYLISFPLIQKIYYGVKYARHCTPEELGVTYFSSSKIVRRHIKQQGLQNTNFEVRRIFNDIEQAKQWETKVLQKFDARNDKRFLNKHNNASFYPVDNRGSKNPMYGLPGTMLGKKHSPESIEKNRLANTGEKNGFYGKRHSSKTLKQLSEKFKGVSKNIAEENPFYGEHHTYDTRNRISETQKKKVDARHTGTYHTPHGVFSTRREAELPNLNCKTLERWCKESDRKITQQMMIRSKYLTQHHIGKTFKELGFYFAP
jgi:hypothetical protein